MSEQSETTAVAVQRPQRLVVQSHVAIMDTARFEHLGRVATVMTHAGILPESLTTYKGKDDQGREVTLFHSFETIQARAFLIASWADRVGMDAHAVAQESSFVHGRLMQSGKLVDAAIQGTIGFELESEYGAWDVKNNCFTSGPRGEGKLLAIRVTAVDENGEIVRNKSDGQPKSVEGYVGGWETTKSGSPWASPSSWLRMLRNRGNREWARAYKSGVMLGVYTPEDRWEADEEPSTPALVAPKSRKRDLSAKLTGGGEGFNADGIAETLGQAAPPAPGREADNDEKAALIRSLGYDAAGVGAPDEAPAGMDAAESAIWHEGYNTKVAEIAAAADAGHDEDGVVNEEPAVEQGLKVRDDINGPAPADVVYLMAGADLVNDKGRIATFKNGAAFSTVTVKGAADLARYTMHPTSASDEPQGDAAASDFPGDRPAASSASAPADDQALADEWEPLERHEGAAPRGVEYTLASDDIEADDTAQAYEDGEPTRRVALRDFVSLPEYEGHPVPLEEVEAELVNDEPTMFDEMAKETSWLPIKARLPKIYGDPEFIALSSDEQKQVRRNIWAIVTAIKEKHRDPVDFATDPSAFRLWCDTQIGKDGADAIEGTFRVLKREDVFKRMSEPQQQKLTSTVEAIVIGLRGA